MPAVELIDMTPPARFRRSHASIKPGTWSDDGALALCLLDSLIEKDGLDLANLATKFIAWGRDGYLAVDAHVFDMGNQTSRALKNLENGIMPEAAGPSDERSNGNGSLMRVLPLALWHRGADDELVALAHAQSLLTHGHLHSQACCALYVLVARHLLDGQPMDEAWDCAEKELAEIYCGSSFAAALEFVLSAKSNAPRGSGYVVDSLWSAKYASQEANYRNVVKAAVALGNDTDTTASIAGGLAGVHFGFDAIPLRWTDILRGRDMVKPLERSLLLRV